MDSVYSLKRRGADDIYVCVEYDFVDFVCVIEEFKVTINSEYEGKIYAFIKRDKALRCELTISFDDDELKEFMNGLVGLHRAGVDSVESDFHHVKCTEIANKYYIMLSSMLSSIKERDTDKLLFDTNEYVINTEFIDRNWYLNSEGLHSCNDITDEEVNNDTYIVITYYINIPSHTIDGKYSCITYIPQYTESPLHCDISSMPYDNYDFIIDVRVNSSTIAGLMNELLNIDMNTDKETLRELYERSIQTADNVFKLLSEFTTF